jgi:hypothetical protein
MRAGQRPLIGYSPLKSFCVRELKRSQWILGATRDRGAWAYKDTRNDVFVADFRMTTDTSAQLDDAILVRPWPELESQLTNRGIGFRIADLSELHLKSMRAAAEFALKVVDVGQVELPAALYLRKSTAEEKIDGW